MKKSFIFTFIMAIVGAIIGAGFVSGKEVVSFFGSYGYFSLFLIALVGVLFFFCFYVFSKLGKNLKPKSISDLTSAMFGRAGVFVDFAFILSSFITLSSMIAGSDAIGSVMFGAGYNFCYISIATVMIVTLVVYFGLKYIYKITDAILPVMLVLIVVVSLVFLFGKSRQFVSIENTSGSAISAIVYFVLYVFMNTFSNIFIIAKTSQYMNRKQIGVACVVSGVILAFLVGFILITVLHGGDEIFLSDMPMLAVANKIGRVFGVVYAIVLWLAIFTTICVVAYTIVEWLFQYIKNKFVCSVITLGLGFVFSRFGFSTIVDIFYPIEGIFGGIFIIYSFAYYFKNKKQFVLKEYASINQSKMGESVGFEIDDIFADARKLEHNVQIAEKSGQKVKNDENGNKKSTKSKKESKNFKKIENDLQSLKKEENVEQKEKKLKQSRQQSTILENSNQVMKSGNKKRYFQTNGNKSKNCDKLSDKNKHNIKKGDIKSIKVEKLIGGFKITKK